jgi:hypothetical protein
MSAWGRCHGARVLAAKGEAWSRQAFRRRALAYPAVIALYRTELPAARGVGLSATAERVTTALAMTTVGVFLIWALARSPQIVDVIYQDSDHSSALVIAQLFGDRGSSDVVLGDYAWLESLYGFLGTRGLPDHLEFWRAAPLLAYAATVAIVGWTVKRSVSPRAGLLVALAMAAPAPIVLLQLGAPTKHAHTLAHAVILAAFLVTLPRLAEWTKGRRGLWAVALAVLLALGVASDPLLLVGGVVPFVAAVTVGWRLDLVARGNAFLAAGACAVGTAAGGLLFELARQDGVRTDGHRFTTAGVGEAVSQMRLLLEDVSLFAHGRLSSSPVLADAILNVVAIAAMVALPIGLLALVRPSLRAVRSPARPVEQRLLAVYWGAVIAGISAGFIVSSAPLDVFSVRYVTLLLPALLTLAVIAFGRPALIGIGVFATVAAGLGCMQLARGTYTTMNPDLPHGTDLANLERFASQERLDHGYAGYWEAATITAESDFRIRAYPVAQCDVGLCPFYLHRIDGWYAPKPGVRTFYLYSPESPSDAGPPPPSWGPPVAQRTFGPLQVFVYEGDLAARLGEPLPA